MTDLLVAERRAAGRHRRHQRSRKRIMGNAARPRLSVYRSVRHLHAQLIDDERGITLASASSVLQELRKSLKHGGNIKAAIEVGRLLAANARKVGITAAVLDRGGYAYHGRVQALVEAVRTGGVQL